MKKNLNQPVNSIYYPESLKVSPHTGSNSGKRWTTTTQKCDIIARSCFVIQEIIMQKTITMTCMTAIPKMQSNGKKSAENLKCF